MKKWMVKLLVGLFAMASFMQGGAFAKQVETPIYLLDGDDKTETSAQALLVDEELLFPADFISKQIYQGANLTDDGRKLQMRFALPRVATGVREVDRELFTAVTLELPSKVVGQTRYVDADAAGTLLGYTVGLKDGANVKMNQHTAFSPRVLEKKEAPSLEGKKINLAWQPTFEAEHSLALLEKHPGLNVVSPSWFAITAADGFVQNNAELSYVKKAHEKGYQVWPLITNSFDPDLTHKVLNNKKAKANVIRQLLIYARLYGLDGINLDFENVYDEDRDALTAFVGEIYGAMRELDVVLSMDLTVPSNISQWSTCYDRTGLSKSLDYVMLMAYDEHWRTSPVSGSVASIGWVERGIVNTLKEVPAEKLVLGVPFYMREWQENLEGEKQVKAKTMTMQRAEQTIAERGLQPVWLEKEGQHYFEYREAGKLYRVWQENKASLALKADLVSKYQLAGIAAWRKGFEKPEVWEMLHEKVQIAPVSQLEDTSHKDKKQKRSKEKTKELHKNMD